MRLTELLNKDEVTISCELFPPKQGAQLENYKNIVKDMAALKPAYMSVTYGATGGTSDYTVKLAEEVRNNNIPALAHLTCASSTKEKVASVIEEYPCTPWRYSCKCRFSAAGSVQARK